VNLYPFARAAANPDTTFEHLVEEIDIGGPSLVRAAARNFQDVLVVVSPADYPAVLEQLDQPGGPTREFRFDLARRAFDHTAAYDRAIATTLETITTDGTQNIVLVLDGVDRSATETWYRVRLAILPNNSTGWVRADNLGTLFTVRTHLYVDRKSLTATLERDGKPIFRADIGIGRPQSPTPRGEFYVRNKLTKYADPFYGPIAFGTNGRSPVLTDWPDGGIVGIHGTNRPDLLPGRVSHGCIHVRNEELLQLARLMPVGTPVTIR